MNEFVQAVHDSAAFGGELKRMLLACGVVGIVGCIAWAIQEWGARKSAVALGWFGIGCLGAVSLLSLALFAVGVL